MAYYIVDRARINFSPTVTTTAGYPGINTVGGSTNIINDITQVFNISSGTTIGGGGISLPTPKIILDDKYFRENGVYYEVDLYDKTANTIGNQIQFLKNIKINTNDFTQDFLDNNLVYIEMMIYKRRNQRTIFPTNYQTWGWGDGSAGQLSFGDISTYGNYIGPSLCVNGDTFREIYCGAYFSIIKDNNNDFYSFGFNTITGNDLGSLGNGTFDFFTGTTSLVAGNHNFKTISCGAGSTFAIDENNDIWSWGSNFYGALGLNDTVDRNQPTKITANTTFTTLSTKNCNYNHSAIDINGNIWVSGFGDGTLGLGSAITQVNILTQITGTTTSFKKVSSGIWHFLALDNDGNVWTFGKNTDGQLGLGLNDNVFVYNFTKVTGLNTVFTHVLCGPKQSYLLDIDGYVWSCGLNDNGELGNNSYIKSNTFQKIFGNIKFKKIDCSLNTGVVFGIDIYNKLWFWGNNNISTIFTVFFLEFDSGNNYNILNLTDFTSNIPIKLNDNLKYYDISVGDLHVLAITKSKGTNPIGKYKRSNYIIPSPYYVTTNYDYPAWGASFWTRSGNHYQQSGGTYVAMNIDRPNHFKVENVNDLIDVTDYFNGRFEEIDIPYRDTTGSFQNLNTVIPNCNGSKRAGNQVNNRFAYSSKYSNLYCAFRYVVFDPTANQGRGQIFAGPISKTVKIAHQYQPFIDDYNANIAVNAPTAFINPKHDKYKFLPRIETKLP